MVNKGKGWTICSTCPSKLYHLVPKHRRGTSQLIGEARRVLGWLHWVAPRDLMGLGHDGQPAANFPKPETRGYRAQRGNTPPL